MSNWKSDNLTNKITSASLSSTNDTTRPSEEVSEKNIDSVDVCVDSGFLSCDISDQNLTINQQEDKLLKSKTVIEKGESDYDSDDNILLTDSGLGGKTSVAGNDRVQVKKESMILDSGINPDITEWCCSLNLKNPNESLNNLNRFEVKTNTTNLNDESKDDGNITITDQVSGIDMGFPQKQQQQLKRQQSTIRNIANNWETFYQQNNDGDTQLHLACINGSIELVCALIRLAPHPCLLDIYNDDVQTALHLAVEYRREPIIVRMLLTGGAQINIRDRNGNTPLHLACIQGDLECLKALLAPISLRDAHKLYNTELKTDKRLMIINSIRKNTQRPNLEIRNYDGERCLHIAIQGNHLDILKQLMWFGADINAREGKSGKTALHLAIEMCNEDLVQFILDNCQQLDAETMTYGGLTPYQHATRFQNDNIIQKLIQFGVDIFSPPDSEDDSDINDNNDEEEYDALRNSSNTLVNCPKTNVISVT